MAEDGNTIVSGSVRTLLIVLGVIAVLIFLLGYWVGTAR